MFSRLCFKPSQLGSKLCIHLVEFSFSFPQAPPPPLLLACKMHTRGPAQLQVLIYTSKRLSFCPLCATSSESNVFLVLHRALLVRYQYVLSGLPALLHDKSSLRKNSTLTRAHYLPSCHICRMTRAAVISLSLNASKFSFLVAMNVLAQSLRAPSCERPDRPQRHTLPMSLHSSRT